MMNDSEIMGQLAKELLQTHEKANGARNDPSKMLIVLEERHRLCKNAISQLTESINLVRVTSIAEGIQHEMMIWQIKKATEEQFAQIVSRIDQLEERIDHHTHDSS